MPASQTGSTIGSKSFNPDQLFEDSELQEVVHSQLNKDDLRGAIIAAFGLPSDDEYVYHATASVTLPQVQAAISAGRSNGLHDWYLDYSSKPCGHPTTQDISAYIGLFDPSKSSANTLKGFVANAKKDSLRSSVGQYLQSKRYCHPSLPAVPRRKSAHANPSLDFWAYACQSLEFAGPNAQTVAVKTSHHVLPVYMHHFGCVCPSYEALILVSLLAKGRTVIDMGSGNGYWTHVLRREHDCKVIPVDSGQSKWRTTWVADTAITDGIRFLRGRDGGLNDVLLLVYPIVSTPFTEQVIREFKGSLICIAGTQNGNGYTGFKDMMVDQWFEINMLAWERVAQVPLPSFPGKDDALFIFQKT